MKKLKEDTGISRRATNISGKTPVILGELPLLHEEPKKTALHMNKNIVMAEWSTENVERRYRCEGGGRAEAFRKE